MPYCIRLKAMKYASASESTTRCSYYSVYVWIEEASCELQIESGCCSPKTVQVMNNRSSTNLCKLLGQDNSVISLAVPGVSALCRRAALCSAAAIWLLTPTYFVTIYFGMIFSTRRFRFSTRILLSCSYLQTELFPFCPPG